MILYIVLFAVWVIVVLAVLRWSSKAIDQQNATIEDLRSSLASSKAEMSALTEQLTLAKNTPWVRCVECRKMVEESDAVEQAMGVWECSHCGDFFCRACGSLECPDCESCIRGCLWAAKANQVCKCADKAGVGAQPTNLFPPRGVNGDD